MPAAENCLRNSV